MKLNTQISCLTVLLSCAIGILLCFNVEASTPGAARTADIDTPTIVLDPAPPKGDRLDKYRSVTCVGRVVYSNGHAACGVWIEAQVQNNAESRLLSSLPSSPQGIIKEPDKDMAAEGNVAKTDSDGKYVLRLSANIPVNIVYFDLTGCWVAKAFEGVRGRPNTSVKLPNMVLTRGSIIEGKVLDIQHHPIPTAAVYCYDSGRPNTSACCDGAFDRADGYYRLRVPSGHCHLYQAQAGDGTASVDLRVHDGEVVTVNLVSNVLYTKPTL